jgi:membrane protease YdiL (CAAX protease family)
MFPDASPERPVFFSCECGKRLTLTAPPETWPLPCPDCGRSVQSVDPETVGGALPPVDEQQKLIPGPGPSAELVRRPEHGGLPAVRDDTLPSVQKQEFVEYEALSFTGKKITKRVAVRPPEEFGAETLALALWLAAVFAALYGHMMLAEGDYTPMSLLLSSSIVAVVTVLFVAFQGHIVKPTLRMPKNAAFWCTLPIAGIPISVGLTLLWFKILENDLGSSFVDETENVFRDPSTSLPLLIIAVGIIPGIFEELGFRGWMQSVWKLTVPAGRALVLTACAFAAAHLSYYSLGWMIPFALYLGWLRERSGSIWPGVIAHMGHNTAMVLLMRFSG